VEGVIARGFYFDAGDPSVGIFGEEWVHGDCALEGDGESFDRRLATTRVNSVTVRDWFLVTCCDCGTQALVSRDDYDPTPEAEAREWAARERWWAETRAYG
jgi:hypothetical protein